MRQRSFQLTTHMHAHSLMNLTCLWKLARPKTWGLVCYEEAECDKDKTNHLQLFKRLMITLLIISMCLASQVRHKNIQ